MAQGIQLTPYATAPQAAFAGMLAEDDEFDAITMNNQGSASIPFGAPVIFKASPTTDKDAALPGTSGDKVAGIAIHSHDYERQFTLQGPGGATTVGELDSTGIVVGAEFACLRRGVIWVLVSTAVLRGSDNVFLSFAAGAVYTTGSGQWGNVTDTNVIQLTNAQWESSAASGGLAKLRLGARVA